MKLTNLINKAEILRKLTAIKEYVMREYLIKVALVAVGPTTIIISVFALWLVVVRADLNSSWLSSASLQSTKVNDLPANVIPIQTNRDCETAAYTKPDASQANDCVVATGQGLMGLNGEVLVPPNTQTGYPIKMVAPSSNSFLLPIPGQQAVLMTTPASTAGNYVSIYDDLSKSLTPSYDLVPFRRLVSYGVSKLPDRVIVDKAGAKIAFNTYGTLGLSANGKWAVVDAPARGMMRINLETYDILPFANSFNPPNDSTDRRVVTAISNDGRYVATSYYQYGEFKVYDLSSCGGTTNDTYSQPLTCQYRDYWPAMANVANGFKNIYRLRFANDDNLSVDLTYDWQSSAVFRAGTFRLTAPGRVARAIDYLALGDSYTSGQGSFVYKAGTDIATNNCHLSTLAYPFIVGAARFNSYNSIACSGAKAKDINGGTFKSYDTTSGGRQASGKESSAFDTEIFTDFLPGYRAQKTFIERYQPSVVTLSIGGNDVGFSAMLQACAVPQTGLPPLSTTCFDNYYDRMQVVRAVQSAYPKLQAVYRDILKTDPGVRLYIVGYPQIVASGNCALNVHLNADEIIFAEHLVAYLNSIVKKAAQSTGAYYVDVENALDGHRMCEATSDQVAINGLTRGNDGGPFGAKIIGSESYHPNQLGNQLLAQAIMRQTNGLSVAMPAAVSNSALPNANDVLAQILLNNYVIGGLSLPATSTVDETISDDVITKEKPQIVTVDGRSNGLRPNSSYQISIGSAANSISVGSYATDSDGNLNLSIVVPSSVANGPQAVRIAGVNSIDQTIVIYKYVYLTTNNNDYDDDGIENSDDTCLVIPNSATDSDEDGIDDACDPLIGGNATTVYYGQVYLTDNVVQARR